MYKIEIHKVYLTSFRSTSVFTLEVALRKRKRIHKNFFISKSFENGLCHMPFMCRNIYAIQNIMNLVFRTFCLASESTNLRITWNNPYLSSKSSIAFNGWADFKIKFKCMSGFTTENVKFIMPLHEKMSYNDSFDSCDSFGFTNLFYELPFKLRNHQKSNESLKKTWTTDSSCQQRKWTEVREYTGYLQLKLAQN